MQNSFKTLLAFLLIISIVAADAQKLPNKQEVSIYAPADIKIDGKANEWNNNYQAYNSATEIFYTIANDDENLYLIIHATKSRIMEKIIEGGVSFTVRGQDKNSPMILFPLLSMNKARSILLIAGKTLSEDMTSEHSMLRTTQPDAFDKKKKSMANANKDLIESLKEIKLNAISAITDTVPKVNSETPYYRFFPMRDHRYKIIGINNKYDIKAMVQFDADGNLNFELKIPVKYLNITIGDTKINYTVTINGRGADRRPNDIISWSFPPAVFGLPPAATGTLSKHRLKEIRKIITTKITCSKILETAALSAIALLPALLLPRLLLCTLIFFAMLPVLAILVVFLAFLRVA